MANVKLTTTHNKAYPVEQVIKTPRTAEPRPERLRFFYALSCKASFAFCYAGCAANTRPVREICPPFLSGFEHLAPTNSGWRQSFLGRGAMKQIHRIPEPSRHKRTPLVSQSPIDWQAGYDAGASGKQQYPVPAGVDALSFFSGWIEGRAAKE